MTINERIKNRRIKLNMTLEEVGKIVGITRQTIQRYESGVISNIPSDKIELLAKALQTSPAYLMGWEDKDVDLTEAIDALTIGVDNKTRTALRIAASFSDEEWALLDKIVGKIVKGIDKNTLLSYIEQKYKE